MSTSDSSGRGSLFDAPAIFSASVTYLVSRGWRRQEYGSGWWWKEGFEEATLGGAIEQQIDADGLDQRDAIAGEPAEYWG